MNERGRRGGGGAPFYAPPRRKTSAEIISEARAAIYGDASGLTEGAGGAGGVLRPLRTRRPYTPREPQRTLFAERGKKRDARPPSAFDLKQLTLSESVESAGVSSGSTTAAVETVHFAATSSGDNKRQSPKKTNPTQKTGTSERSGDGWSAFPKLPHLSGRSKPLHRRSTLPHTDEAKIENDLMQSICVIKPLKGGEVQSTNKTPSPGASSKSRPYCKSISCDVTGLRDVNVRHLAVQLPLTSLPDYNNLSFVEIAENLMQKNRDIDRNLLLIETLHRLLSVNIPSQNIQELLLRAMYSLFDVEDERLMAGIAKAMLMMRVTKQHLSAACKLVFKLARNDKNDHFFKNSDLLELLIEGCGRADPLTEGESCVYGAGALRFLALDPTLCEMARNTGALHLAALHMKILNNAKSSSRHVSDQSNHSLYQLTGALRNLATGGDARVFVTSGALSELVVALRYHTDRDVLTNVARCLSVLSSTEECCVALVDSPAACGSLLAALSACASRAPLALRLAYVLGNLCTYHKASTQVLNEEGGVDVLLTILESYTKRNDNGFRNADADPDMELVGTDLGGSDGSNEDVLIKTVRVLANLCLSPANGAVLAATHAPRALRALLGCLAVAQAGTAHANESRRETRGELAAASLAALNNITFYRDGNLDADDDTMEQLCKVCIWWISHDLELSNGNTADVGSPGRDQGAAGAAGEALRALGNLSRSPQAAQAIVLYGVLDSLERFYTHADSAVRCSAAGVLVNVCGAGAGGAGAAHATVNALVSAANRHDAPAAALLTRALWNAHCHDLLDSVDATAALQAIDAFIDDDSVFAACEATRGGRRASEPEVSNSLAEFNHDSNQNAMTENQKPFSKAYSVDQNLHLHSDLENGGTSGEDLDFEDAPEEECDCSTCRRLSEWEELISVAIPLLEKLRPPKTDVCVSTDEIFRSVRL